MRGGSCCKALPGLPASIAGVSRQLRKQEDPLEMQLEGKERSRAERERDLGGGMPGMRGGHRKNPLGLLVNLKC